MEQQQAGGAGEAMSLRTVTGVLLLWAALRTDAGELRKRTRAGAFRGCRLSWSPSDYRAPVLWTAAARRIGPRDSRRCCCSSSKA